MRALDDHISGRVDEYERRMTWIRFHQPNNDGDIIRDVLEDHRNGAVCLEEIDCTAVVVCEYCGFWLECRIGVG